MKKEKISDLNRRKFLKGSSLTTLMMLMGGVAIRAEDKPKTDEAKAEEKPAIPPVSCAVIGCGAWGREVLMTLAAMPIASVAGMCDTYTPYLNRAKKSAPKAETYEDYHKLLEQKDLKAVIVATPSHLHRQIVIDALQAGKHVYCEAPLATTVEDARAIALAARAAGKLYFQAGLQSRADPQRKFILDFVRTGVMGKTIEARAQHHKKESWRRTSPSPEHEKKVNWRLSNETSIGLIGEIGIHAVDVGNWYLMNRPVAVTGFGSLINWQDGRDVADTVKAIFEYPNGVNFSYDCTLANSFDNESEMFYGTDCTIMWRDRRAWMFKEVDSPLLGWEVYAKKETFYKESGIVLGANATKQKSLAKNASPDLAGDPVTALEHAMESFLRNTNTITAGLEDFTANFGGADAAALKEYIANLGKDLLPAAGYKEGYESAVTVIKANEAIRKGQRIVFSKEWFELV
ncbi:MAG: Gfo/Idh/MocA family oxidoreductase [Limisphaerales bacterium]